MYQAEFHVPRNRNVGKNVIRKFLSLYKEVVEYEDQVVDDGDDDDDDDDDDDEDDDDDNNKDRRQPGQQGQQGQL